MTTDLIQIKRLGEQKRDENLRFRKFLKPRNVSERVLRRTAQSIEEAIDCTQCANCCRLGTAKLQDRDVDRLAKLLRLTSNQFIAQYTTPSEEEGLVLKRTESGCVFLEGNLCSVYDDRPTVCRHYPHLTQGDWSIQARMWQFVDRAAICPIVYHSLEAFKELTGFRR